MALPTQAMHTGLSFVTGVYHQIPFSLLAPILTPSPPSPTRLPDGSVSSAIVNRDISSMASIGAGGVEFLPFYLYGLVYANIDESSAPPGSIAPPTDWSIYGFGDEAFKALFKDALQAVKDIGDGFVIDFPLGPNQGAGVPSAPSSEGLAVHLVSFFDICRWIHWGLMIFRCQVTRPWPLDSHFLALSHRRIYLPSSSPGSAFNTNSNSSEPLTSPPCLR